jgi:hypothetical protein
MDKYGHTSKTSDFYDKKNVQKCILLYKNEHLFQKNNTVRFHKGFEEVINSIHVKEPLKLQCRFTKYSTGLTDPVQATGKLYHLRLQVECTLSCNLQSWARTQAVLMIGLYTIHIKSWFVSLRVHCPQLNASNRRSRL